MGRVGEALLILALLEDVPVGRDSILDLEFMVL